MRIRSRRGWGRAYLGIGLAGVLVVGGLAAAVAQAPVAGAVDLGMYTTAITPASVAAGTTQTLSLTVANDLLAPSLDVLTGFTITTTGYTLLGASGAKFTTSIAGDTATFSGGDVLPESSATFSIEVTAPTAAPQSFTWPTSGTGLIGGLIDEPNDFAKQGADPVVTTVAGPASQLAFTTQPSETLAGALVTPAPVVTAEDQYGNVATTYAGPVSVTATPAPTDSPDLPLSVTPSNGLATLDNLYLGEAGSYQLVATGGSFTATSSSFTVDPVSSATLCSAGESCTSSTVSGDSDTNTDDAALGAGSAPDLLTVSLGPGVTSPTTCATPPGYTGVQLVGDSSQVDNHDPSRTSTITLTFDDPSLFEYGGTVAICYESNQTFPGATATGTGLYYGILDTCASTGNAVPCGEPFSEDGYNVTDVVLAQSGDPLLQFSSLLSSL